MELNEFDLAEAGRKGAAAGKALREELLYRPVEACIGCMKNVPTRIHGLSMKTAHCKVYRNPAVMMRWVDGKSLSGCGFNYRNLVKTGGPKDRKRVGQQKQKRRNR